MGKSGTFIKTTWALLLLQAITPFCQRTCHIRDADKLVRNRTEKINHEYKRPRNFCYYKLFVLERSDCEWLRRTEADDKIQSIWEEGVIINCGKGAAQFLISDKKLRKASAFFVAHATISFLYT